MTFLVEVTGKRLDGTDYLLSVETEAGSVAEAKDKVENGYDWENAQSMNFTVQPL